MTRPVRQSTNVQLEAPADAASAEAPKAARLTAPWRVALFIWASAFLWLLVYELLTTLVRSLSLLK